MKYFTFMVTDAGAEPYVAEDDNIAEWVAETIAAGTNVDGDRIRPREEARTVRVRNGELLITEGPFTESAEWINGWDVQQFADLDEAIATMRRHPMARYGHIEIRPFWVDPDEPLVDAPIPAPEQVTGNRYIMFVAVDGDPDTDDAPEPDIDEWVATWDAAGKRLTGDRLADPADATVVRQRNGALHLTEGPFVEAKEFIVGYDLLAADSMDEAIAIAAAHPMARGGRIEVRQCWPLELF